MNQPSQPNRRLNAAEIERRRALRKKQRRQKQLRAAALLILLLAICILAIVFIAKSCGKKTPVIPQDPSEPSSSASSENGSASDTDSAEPPTSEAVTEPVEQAPSFTADLSAYEEYMNPTDRDAYLTLVNATHPLASDFIPADLTDLVNTRGDGRAMQKMSLYAAKALEALFIEAKAENQLTVNQKSGYPLSVMSAYRSYAYQSSLFSHYTDNEMARSPALTREQAEAITVTYSNRPGTSEHQLGLCVDMHDLSGADVSFKNSTSYPWLSENAWKFGFILRYPEDKVSETAVSFEPWHYRYVGRYHAKKIHDAGLCLEEYIVRRESGN